MDAHPGLTPGNAILRTAGSVALPCARLKNWGNQGDLHPPPRRSQRRMLTITLRSPLDEEWILRPAPPRHRFLYERSALLCSATEELDQDLGFKNWELRFLKWCSREDLHLELRSSQNRVQNSYTSGAFK